MTIDRPGGARGSSGAAGRNATSGKRLSKLPRGIAFGNPHGLGPIAVVAFNRQLVAYHQPSFEEANDA
jgi:hypothetical protein